MKFCGNCGTQLSDDAVFCTNCGSSLGNDANTQPVNPYSTGNTAQHNAPNGNVKNNTKKFIGIAVAVVCLVVVIAVASFIVNNFTGYKPVVRQVFAAIEKADAEKFMDLIEFYNEDIDEDDAIEELEDALERRIYSFEDELGNKIKLSPKVTKENKYSSKRAKSFGDGIEDEFMYFDSGDLKGVISVDLDVKVSGSDRSRTIRLSNIIFVKVDGKWKLSCTSFDNMYEFTNIYY